MYQQQQVEEEQLFDNDYYAKIDEWWCSNAYDILFQKEEDERFGSLVVAKFQYSEQLLTQPSKCIFTHKFNPKRNHKQYQDFLDNLRNSTFPIVRITLAGHEGEYGFIQNTVISEKVIQDICKNLPKTCVAVVFENITCRQHPEHKYKIPTEIIYGDNDSKIAGWVDLDEAVSNALKTYSNINWLILGQTNKGSVGSYDAEHLRLWCRNQTTEQFTQQKEIDVKEALKNRQDAAKKKRAQGYTVKVPDQGEINKEQYKLWLDRLISKNSDKDTTDKYKEYDDDITEQQFKDLSLSQQQYENIITKVIEGNFTTADESLKGRECNIFDLINALENYKKNDNSRQEICRHGWFAKAFSFGKDNAKLRRINQLAKILEGVYTKNMNLEEKRKAKQNWKTNKPDKHDQLITWLDLEYISKNTKASTIHNNH